MAPKLYGILFSPPVRSVILCAKVLEVDLEFVPVNLLTLEHMKKDYLQKNPQHSLPLLEEEDGFLLTDSHAIMGYLVNRYGKDDSLYPKNDSRLRAVIDHRLHFDSSVLFIRGFYISRALMFQKTLPTEERIQELREAFKIVDTLLETNKTQYIAGNSLTIADFSVTTSVTTLNFFTPYAEFPNLKAYIERMQKQPWYEANEEGLAIYNKLASGALSELKNQKV